MDPLSSWRVPDQSGISQACYIVKIYHSGPEPSICSPWIKNLFHTGVCSHACEQVSFYLGVMIDNNNNNNNERISRVPFHVEHAQLR